jgi:sortase A
MNDAMKRQTTTTGPRRRVFADQPVAGLRNSGPRQHHRLRWRWLLAERAAWAFGFVCLASWGAFYVAGLTGARHEVYRFGVLRAAAQLRAGSPDQSLWSAERVRAWQSTLNDPASPPLAVLRIPRIGLEVAVLQGTDDFTLNRAVGHIADTARPGTDGNSGIAGHRDGFFRGLKDIVPGDVIELETLDGSEVYRVERTWIVDPEDVSVLDPTPTRSLTLVTCHPFYFIGSAPQRYIVRAVRTDGAASRSSEPLNGM